MGGTVKDSITFDNDHREADSEPETGSNDGTNTAWANSISKILSAKKPPRKSTLILSKAKKLTDLKSTRMVSAGYEVATADGQIKEEKIEVKTDLKSLERNVEKVRKRKVLPSVRAKPKIEEKDHERTLQKIATKGVVQLFNAVSSQQQELRQQMRESGPSTSQKIDKKQFFQRLNNCPADMDVDQLNSENEEEPNWSVLRDDFGMSAKLKDWDKEMTD